MHQNTLNKTSCKASEKWQTWKNKRNKRKPNRIKNIAKSNFVRPSNVLLMERYRRTKWPKKWTSHVQPCKINFQVLTKGQELQKNGIICFDCFCWCNYDCLPHSFKCAVQKLAKSLLLICVLTTFKLLSFKAQFVIFY